MGYQDVEAGSGQAVEVFRENRVAVEQRQAAGPGLAGSEVCLEFGASAEGWEGLVPGVQDPRPEDAGQSRDANFADGGYVQTEIARGGAEIVVGDFGFRIVIAEDPPDIPTLPDRRGKYFAQRRGQVAVTEQDQRAGRTGGAGAEDGGEVPVRITQSWLAPNGPRRGPLGRRLGGQRSGYRAASRSGRCPPGR